MKTIVDIINSDNCFGCGACINSCPTNALMYSTDEFGFFRPKINLSKCISCRKCFRVCPKINNLTVNKPLNVYAAINKDADILVRSASGGIFCALAESVIAQGGCVFGASLDEGFRVRHICIEKIEDIPLLQKSKYVQSFVGDSYKIALEKLKNGKKVLFSGTPCQVAAMKSFVGSSNENLILVEVVCHGIPSQKFFKEYIQCLNKKYGKIKDYLFTYKRKVLNGMNKYISFITKKEKIIIKDTPQDSYNSFFMDSINYQKSCYSCKFAQAKRVSDLTICDFWFWEKYHKKDFPSCSTLSGICVNTDVGYRELNIIREKLVLVRSSFANLSAHNGCLIRPTPINLKRDAFLQEWILNGYEHIEHEFKKKNRFRIIKYKLRMLLPERLKFWLHNMRSRHEH